MNKKLIIGAALVLVGVLGDIREERRAQRFAAS